MFNVYLYYNKESYRKDLEIVNLNINCTIDYKIIETKLTKNDYLKEPPKPEVLSTAIYRKIRNLYRKKEEQNILYILRDLDKSVLLNLHKTFNQLSTSFKKPTNVYLINKSDRDVDIPEYKE